MIPVTDGGLFRHLFALVNGMKKLVYILVVALVSYAYLILPEALLSYAPLKYESATLYFDRVPKDGLESLQVPQSLEDEISLFQCKAVQPDEESGRRAAAVLSCIVRSEEHTSELQSL